MTFFLSFIFGEKSFNIASNFWLGFGAEFSPRKKAGSVKKASLGGPRKAVFLGDRKNSTGTR